MNLRHIIIFLLSLSVLAGCKKDDLSDVDLMMEGDPIIDIDDYVAIGSEWALEAGGITKPEEGVGYFWTLKGMVDENDTTDVFRFKFGYETGEYRLSRRSSFSLSMCSLNLLLFFTYLTNSLFLLSFR